MSYEYVGTELEVFALATNWKQYFGELLRPYISGAVLEVGAGIGETTRALWRPVCDRWVCLEPDAKLADQLQSTELMERPSLELVVGEISELPERERFDSIIYIDVLEHIPDDAAQLTMAARHLRSGGHLVVLSPAYPALYSPFDAAIGHERRYTARALRAVFPDSLVHVRTFYADALGAALSFANALVLKQSLPKRNQILFWDRVVIPLSRAIDPLVGRRFGRSVISVYRSS